MEFNTVYVDKELDINQHINFENIEAFAAMRKNEKLEMINIKFISGDILQVDADEVVGETIDELYERMKVCFNIYKKGKK